MRLQQSFYLCSKAPTQVNQLLANLQTRTRCWWDLLVHQLQSTDRLQTKGYG